MPTKERSKPTKYVVVSFIFMTAKQIPTKESSRIFSGVEKHVS